jgi:hypothetical protein
MKKMNKLDKILSEVAQTFFRVIASVGEFYLALLIFTNADKVNILKEDGISKLLFLIILLFICTNIIRFNVVKIFKNKSE